MAKGITIDSGAADNVMPRRLVRGKFNKVRPSPGSRAGLHYLVANNARIADEGETDFQFITGSGDKENWVFQVAEVNKPLGSVAHFVDREYRVVFDQNSVTGEDLSYMVHKPTKKTYRFRRCRNIWILDAIVDLADFFGDFSRPE